LRIVSSTPPQGTVRDLGTVHIPNQEMCHQWMEDRWNFGICAQKAHPACFQRMNSWDGNLSDLPSCLDLGLRQSASNLYRYWIGRLQIPKRPRISRGLCPKALVNAVTEDFAMATSWYFPALVTGETGVMKSALSAYSLSIAVPSLSPRCPTIHCLAAMP
jgi:hypothetical protein